MMGGDLEHGKSVLVPLSSLLSAVGPNKLNEARRRLRLAGRDNLIERFREAQTCGKRVAAHLLAEALVWHGIPPFAWHQALVLDRLNINQRYDLFAADLLWLRRHYPDHAKIVRYRRCKTLLTRHGLIFHREAEFAFYQGQRPAWRLVGSLSLTERQQWDCAWLRSTPIRRCAEAMEVASPRVFKALESAMGAVRRTSAFGEVEAMGTLKRRHALWRCSCMVRDDGPAEIATRYEQMTGEPITRQVVAKQLKKTREMLVGMKVKMS